MGFRVVLGFGVGLGCFRVVFGLVWFLGGYGECATSLWVVLFGLGLGGFVCLCFGLLFCWFGGLWFRSCVLVLVVMVVLQVLLCCLDCFGLLCLVGLRVLLWFLLWVTGFRLFGLL